METTDRALLRQAHRGDADAFAAFFRRHERTITGFAVNRCASPEDVADAVAETFFIALRRAGSFHDAADTARPWLIGIASKVILGQHRSRRRSSRLAWRASGWEPELSEGEHEAVASAIDAARSAGAVSAAVADLPVGERAVLELVARDGLEPAEAAVTLGLSPNAARLRLSRARRRVRAALDDEADTTGAGR